MLNLTTLSWKWFFILGLILVIIWIISTKMRIGRTIVTQETPWTLPQWSRLLLVIGITLFILVDPIFHLSTVAIFAILYYVFVNKNFLNTNIRKLGIRNDSLSGTLPFISGESSKVDLLCKSTTHENMVKERKALDRCLFSFPQINDLNRPEVKYLDGEYHVTLSLSSSKYMSSLMEYIRKAGFEVSNKIQK